MAVIALSGAILNAMYGAKLLAEFFNPINTDVIREILISAIILEFAWAALLVWVIFNPFERRHILLFTVFPVLLGNFMHSLNQLMGGQTDKQGGIVLNTIFGLIYAGLYAVAYYMGKSGIRRE